MIRTHFVLGFLGVSVALIGCGSPPPGPVESEAKAIAAEHPESGPAPLMSEVDGLAYAIVKWRNALPEQTEIEGASKLIPVKGGYVQKVEVKRQLASGEMSRQTWLFTLKDGGISESTQIE